MYFFYIKKHALMLKTDNLVGIFFVIMCAKKRRGFLCAQVHHTTMAHNILNLQFSLSLLLSFST